MVAEYPRVSAQGYTAVVGYLFTTYPLGAMYEYYFRGLDDLSSGFAAKQAVPAFEFRPGMRSGQPVACRVEIPIHFEQR